MADDDDMGTTFLKQHMSEAQTSTEPGALGNKSRSANPKGSDGYYSDKYGKDVDLSGNSKPVVVNREDKASSTNTGAIGTDTFYSQKYGGDGITGGRKPKSSQKNKTLSYD